MRNVARHQRDQHLLAHKTETGLLHRAGVGNEPSIPHGLPAMRIVCAFLSRRLGGRAGATLSLPSVTWSVPFSARSGNAITSRDTN
jgi:hypothetical protein